VSELVRDILQQAVTLSVPVSSLSEDDDLYEAGLSSFDLITLITTLEEKSRVEFPLELMVRETFATIERISSTIDSLLREQHQA
jgi:acyl carrier protein